jgi:hypothetical protein
MFVNAMILIFLVSYLTNPVISCIDKPVPAIKINKNEAMHGKITTLKKRRRKDG